MTVAEKIAELRPPEGLGAGIPKHTLDALLDVAEAAAKLLNWGIGVSDDAKAENTLRDTLDRLRDA